MQQSIQGGGVTLAPR